MIPTTPNSKDGFAAEFEAGPIPGQSLTRAPGSYPFEQPPQYTSPEEAFDALINGLSKPESTSRLLNMLELGVPVYTLVYTILMSGFTEGKWTPDVALLMAEPLSALMFRLGKEAGIEVVSGVKKEEDDMLELVLQKKLAAMPPPEMPMDPAMPSLMDAE